MAARVMVLVLCGLTGLAHGQCRPGDFSVELGRIQTGQTAGTATYKIPLILNNGNAVPCGAQIEVRMLDSDGQLVAVQSGWPASTGNIPPGDDVASDWGPRFLGVQGGQQISVKIRSARQW